MGWRGANYYGKENKTRREGGRERGRKRREGGVDGVTECACLTSATANCREIEGMRKRGKNKHMREERKNAPIELHYCCRKEREEKIGRESGGKEERIMGLMPADKQQWRWG